MSEGVRMGKREGKRGDRGMRKYVQVEEKVGESKERDKR